MIYIVNTEILLKVALNTITHTSLTVINKQVLSNTEEILRREK
jgi:hypothetical protein